MNRDPSLTKNYKRDVIKKIYDQYGKVNKLFADKLKQRVLDMDPDHVWELQLGGPDIASNLKLLDSDTNRNIGLRQIWPQIRQWPVGTRITIKIEW